MHDKWSPFDHADTYRALAERDRARGSSSVRVFASTNEQYRRQDAAMTNWQKLATVAHVAFADACSEAKAAYRWDIDGDNLTAPGFGDL